MEDPAGVGSTSSVGGEWFTRLDIWSPPLPGRRAPSALLGCWEECLDDFPCCVETALLEEYFTEDFPEVSFDDFGD